MNQEFKRPVEMLEQLVHGENRKIVESFSKADQKSTQFWDLNGVLVSQRSLGTSIVRIKSLNN